MSALRVLVAAGGTGGHFYPALAVLEALAKRTAIEPLFVGTPRGIEARAVPALGHPLELFELRGLNGLPLGRKLVSLGLLPRAGLGCWRLVRRFRPAVMLSVGGYVSGPVTLASVLQRVPTAVLEPNAVPGLTNRLLGRHVQRALLAYDESSRWFRSEAVRVVGVPVRAGFLERAARARGGEGSVPHVLLLGGSQGARALNEAMPGAASLLAERGVRFTLTHQTGVHDEQRVRERYGALGFEAEVRAFIDDAAGAMARAQLVLCRSGAGTVAELGVLGRPGLFVPLPTAADDHQRKNAEAVAARGAGVCLSQKELTPERLAGELEALLGAPERLSAMAQRALEGGRPEAAERAADAVMELAGR